MKNKILLLVLLVLPALFWVFFEKVKINSYRLNYYGPKKVVAPGDTLFHTVAGDILSLPDSTSCLLVLLQPEYLKEQFHIQSLLELLLYKPEKVSGIPIVFVYEKNLPIHFLKNIQNPKSQTRTLKTDSAQLQKIKNELYRKKPYYVFDYFAVLLDRQRHIRGYYNFTFMDEVKRMIQEYKHLRLKEESRLIKQQHEIKQKS